MARKYKAKGSRAGMQRGELTPGEIQKNAPKPNDGFTIRATGRGVGKPARNVFSTGYAPDTGRGAEVAIDPNMPVEEQMSTFNKNKLDVLGSSGGPFALGGWNDPETGKVQMDTSVLTPRTMGGLSAALHIASEGSQESVGNLGKKGYEGDIALPSHLQKNQFVYPESTTVEDLGNVGTSGRRRVRITPSRQEMVNVEAEEIGRSMGLPDDLSNLGMKLA